MPTYASTSPTASPDGQSNQGESDEFSEFSSALIGFSQRLCGLRKEAIEGRKNSGIEATWQEDMDAYEGRDHGSGQGGLEKGETLDGGAYFTGGTGMGEVPTRANAYLNITRPYVDAAAARIADMLLPTDELPFAVEPTAKTDKRYFLEMVATQAGAYGAEVDMNALAEAFAEEEALAREKSSAAELQIKDWMQEGKWHGEGRKVIEWSAKIGVGVLKGPFPERRNFGERVLAALEVLPPEMAPLLEFLPRSTACDPWNIFPDPSCGESPHDGSYLFERMPITQRRLRELKADSRYISSAVELCLSEGPQDYEGKPTKDARGRAKKSFELWLYTGMVPRELLETEAELLESVDQTQTWNAAGYDDDAPGKNSVFAQAVLCNGRLVRVSEMAVPTSEFPYQFFRWQRRVDHWAGIGVARQLETPQRGLNASLRNMLDNAALSAGPMLVFFEDLIEPINGRYEISPRKLFRALQEATQESISAVANAITTIEIPSYQAELMNMIQFFLKMAEESTGLPLLLQGQMGSGTPNTVGGMQLMTNAATTVLRRLARSFDDDVTEPNVGGYYSWIKEYGPESCRGDVMIRARGSSVLVERELQTQSLVQLLSLAKDPAYKLSPERLAKTYVESQRFDYDAIRMTDEEFAAAQEAAQAPQVQEIVAQIKAEVEKYSEDLRAQVKREEMAMDAKIELVKVQADREAERLQAEAGEADKVLESVGFGAPTAKPTQKEPSK